MVNRTFTFDRLGMLFLVLVPQKTSIGTIRPSFQCRSHITMFRHQLWRVWASRGHQQHQPAFVQQLLCDAFLLKIQQFRYFSCHSFYVQNKYVTNRTAYEQERNQINWEDTLHAIPNSYSICFYKQSMRLSCRFLQIEDVNQKFPQMTLFRLKTRHFRTQKNILYW